MEAYKKTGDNTGATVATLSPLDLLAPWQHDLIADDRSSHTVRRYVSAVRHFLQWYEAEERRPLTLDDLTPMTLIGYRNELQHHQSKATSTVNSAVAALRAWCAWLHERAYLASTPAARLKFVGHEAGSAPQGLKDREINALLRAGQHTRYAARDYAVLQLLLQTGMRIGECAALNYEDIVFGERSGSVTIRAGKGNKTRSVPLNGSARTALAQYVAARLGVAPLLAATAVAWPRRQPGAPPTPLWRSQKGGRLSTSAMRDMIDTLVGDCAARGLVPPDTSAHTLRHTFGMNYLKANPGDLFGLAALLGHTSLDTTRIYGQPTDDQLAARVDRLHLNAYAE
jgi:site-specific recombinase XerD